MCTFVARVSLQKVSGAGESSLTACPIATLTLRLVDRNVSFMRERKRVFGRKTMKKDISSTSSDLSTKYFTDNLTNDRVGDKNAKNSN